MAVFRCPDPTRRSSASPTSSASSGCRERRSPSSTATCTPTANCSARARRVARDPRRSFRHDLTSHSRTGCATAHWPDDRRRDRARERRNRSTLDGSAAATRRARPTGTGTSTTARKSRSGRGTPTTATPRSFVAACRRPTTSRSIARSRSTAAAAGDASFACRLFDGADAVTAEIAVGPQSAWPRRLNHDERRAVAATRGVSLEPGHRTGWSSRSWTAVRACVRLDGKVVLPADLPPAARRGEVSRPLQLGRGAAAGRPQPEALPRHLLHAVRRARHARAGHARARTSTSCSATTAGTRRTAGNGPRRACRKPTSSVNHSSSTSRCGRAGDGRRAGPGVPDARLVAAAVAALTE